MPTSTTRQPKIESYGRAHEQLTAAIQRYPRQMWQFRPAPEQWTIHEILVHITDSEANSYIRCRRLIAEPGSDVLGYEGDKWARDLAYHEQNVEDALELFKWLRYKSYSLIKNLPESIWANTINHSENGRMTFDDWLNVYERHIPEHIEQMDAVYAEWQTHR